MNKNLHWVLFTGLVLATAGIQAADKPTDFEAEKKQAEKEEAEQKAERDAGTKGKYQKIFFGTVHILADANPKLSPEVLGNFETSNQDKKPGRNYQLKLDGDSKALADTLRKLDGKSAQLTGKLRVIGADGEAKYLIVSSVVEMAPTPKIPERRSGSGL